VSAIPKPKPVYRPELIVYPESDGKPMADNTKQYRWIRRIEGNVSILYKDDPNVFVAGDLLWYPEEGFPEVVSAPDVMVAFGRPKGDRGSYKQWLEGNVAPQVVFEILSPSNTYEEMEGKLDWYEDHEVEEYYVYNPDTNTLRVYVRDGSVLRRRRDVNGFVSPRLGIRFDLSGSEMAVYYPDGRRFLTMEEIDALRAEIQKRADAADKRADAADKRADEADKRADAADKRASRLAELGRRVRRGEASAEEIAELERLEDSAS
jgi:Uma2 family endonuclease